MTKLAVNGALGRMGNRILTLAHQGKDFKVSGAFENSRSASLGKDLGLALGLGESLGIKVSELSPASLKGSDVLIDFSSPKGAIAALDVCLQTKTPIVIGTTGIEAQDVAKIVLASKKIPVLFSANMSLGVNYLLELVRQATGVLGKKYGYDIEITEAHHKLKKDAPSGTAKKIAEVIAKEMRWDLSSVSRYGRTGLTGERKSDELGIHVIRSGDIVGDHTVSYGGPGEVIEISHRALSRDVFAKGALTAARFLAKKPKGFYSMADVLNI